MLTIYGDQVSGNCLKVKYVADYLGLDYEWVHIDVLAGEACSDEFLKINPAGQVPALVLADGRCLSQSNAIMRFLAKESRLIPSDDWEAALMDSWLFWEQYSHETAIAVSRFQVKFLGKTPDPKLLEKGNAALDLMEEHLSKNTWFAGSSMSLADIALLAYTQFAPDGGFDLDTRPNVCRWLTDTKQALNIS